MPIEALVLTTAMLDEKRPRQMSGPLVRRVPERPLNTHTDSRTTVRQIQLVRGCRSCKAV